MSRLVPALVLLTACASARQETAPTLAWDARCQQELLDGHLDEADAACARAVAANPKDFFSLHNRATIAFSRGDLVAVKSFANRALAANPDFAPSINTLGALSRAQGDLGGAAARFKAALVLKPDFIEARWNLGEVRRLQRDWPAAEAEYRKLTEAHPDLVDPWIGLARALAGQGRKADAQEAYRRCLAIDELPECVQELAELK